MEVRKKKYGRGGGYEERCEGMKEERNEGKKGEKRKERGEWE